MSILVDKSYNVLPDDIVWNITRLSKFNLVSWKITEGAKEASILMSFDKTVLNAKYSQTLKSRYKSFKSSITETSLLKKLEEAPLQFDPYSPLKSPVVKMEVKDRSKQKDSMYEEVKKKGPHLHADMINKMADSQSAATDTDPNAGSGSMTKQTPGTEETSSEEITLKQEPASPSSLKIQIKKEYDPESLDCMLDGVKAEQPSPSLEQTRDQKDYCCDSDKENNNEKWPREKVSFKFKPNTACTLVKGKTNKTDPVSSKGPTKLSYKQSQSKDIPKEMDGQKDEVESAIPSVTKTTEKTLIKQMPSSTDNLTTSLAKLTMNPSDHLTKRVVKDTRDSDKDMASKKSDSKRDKAARYIETVKYFLDKVERNIDYQPKRMEKYDITYSIKDSDDQTTFYIKYTKEKKNSTPTIIEPVSLNWLHTNAKIIPLYTCRQATYRVLKRDFAGCDPSDIVSREKRKVIKELLD